MPRRQNTADLFADDVPISTKAQIRHAMNEESHQEEDEYPRASPNTGNRKGSLSSSRRELREAGRDGGGSQSGAVSRSGTPSSEEDEDAPAKERMKMLPTKGSLAMALNGGLNDSTKPTRPYRARADTLGDQSDVDDDTEEIQEIKRQEIADKSFEGSVH